MYIYHKIQKLLSEDELQILIQFGDLLYGLASGTIAPRTQNQEHFVKSAAENFKKPLGRSEIAWSKFIQLNELFTSNEELTSQVTSLEQDANFARAYIPLLERTVSRQISAQDADPWDKAILDALPADNRQSLLPLSMLFILRNLEMISGDEFETLAKVSGAWMAIHNYEKLGKPVSALPPHRPTPQFDICASCGAAILNGYCRCSD